MSDLQEMLEKTESGQTMVALVDSLVEVSAWRPRLFEPTFQVGNTVVCTHRKRPSFEAFSLRHVFNPHHDLKSSLLQE